ncbi:GNAT family N-acetyltransferase [Dethiothermospora halolimnae]|uniref:GNAT family N-acetyltransferase n=1 Tax=Dethiothermospora halolimnae TaxID=3114390 RepID=UPI003CCC0AAC
MEKLINKGQKYCYTSLLYTNEEKIGYIGSDGILEEQEYIFMIKEEENQFHIHWAAETKKDFFYGLEKSLKLIEKNNTNEKRIYIEFIPKEFIKDLEKLGFKINSHFCDFWLEDIKRIKVHRPLFGDIRLMKEEEYREVAAVTRSCKGLSRGFNGEKDIFAKEWIQNENSSIVVAESDNKIVGVCFMNVYGFEGDKGPVAWVREVAVHPNYQGKGIGYSLIYYGLNWGKERGAIRSFLAVDSINYNAIKLYEKIGYKKEDGSEEISMVKE